MSMPGETIGVAAFTEHLIRDLHISRSELTFSILIPGIIIAVIINVIGGVPGAMFAAPFTAKDMENHVRKIIRTHKESGKFIIGVADQVPPDGDISFVKLISDVVEEHGGY